ncbi:hypothetical protein PLUTE_a5324 [Pseudoalteromonas luteoviolacea DSM 6061]|nr:hypothetical protein [Pseudoalteromonas luteoviolacea DSM 6061]
MYKLQSIVWDAGCDETSEWVFASTEDARHKEGLLKWLGSKNIDPSCEVVRVNSLSAEIERIVWSDILKAPELYFSGKEFKIYDVDLAWVLEYAPQEIARFGRV